MTIVERRVPSLYFLNKTNIVERMVPNLYSLNKTTIVERRVPSLYFLNKTTIVERRVVYSSLKTILLILNLILLTNSQPRDTS